MFLLGNFQHSLDDKNRIRLPSNFRKEMGDEYFLMPGSNGCIFVYKADETQKVLSTLLSLESLDPDQSLMLTKIAAFSRAVTADGQGRFMLPDDLIELWAHSQKRKFGARKHGKPNSAAQPTCLARRWTTSTESWT